MNRHRIAGRWRQIRGLVRERLGKLRHNDLAVLRGRRDLLMGRLQELYGLAKEEAHREVTALLRILTEPEAPRSRVRVRIVRRRRRTRTASRR